MAALLLQLLLPFLPGHVGTPLLGSGSPKPGEAVRKCGSVRRPAPFSGQLSPWPAFGTPGVAWSRPGTGSRPGWGGAPHSTQMPRRLALSLLSWVLRRINSLRSGVWARWRSYSRRFSCLAPSSARVGSTRGFGVLGWGVAFRDVFTAGSPRAASTPTTSASRTSSSARTPARLPRSTPAALRSWWSPRFALTSSPRTVSETS